MKDKLLPSYHSKTKSFVRLIENKSCRKNDVKQTTAIFKNIVLKYMTYFNIVSIQIE